MNAQINFNDEDELRMVLKTVADVDRLSRAIKALFTPEPQDEDKDLSLQEWVSKREFRFKDTKHYFTLLADRRFIGPDKVTIIYKPNKYEVAHYNFTEEVLAEIRSGESDSLEYRLIQNTPIESIYPEPLYVWVSKHEFFNKEFPSLGWFTIEYVNGLYYDEVKEFSRSYSFELIQNIKDGKLKEIAFRTKEA